jgi:hypothetical protein
MVDDPKKDIIEPEEAAQLPREEQKSYYIKCWVFMLAFEAGMREARGTPEEQEQRRVARMFRRYIQDLQAACNLTVVDVLGWRKEAHELHFQALEEVLKQSRANWHKGPDGSQ